MNTLLLGETLAILAAATGAVSSIILEGLGKNIDSSLLGFVRMIIVVPIMILAALITDGTAILCVPFSQISWIIVSGIIGFFVTDIFLFRAYAVFGAQETMVVMCFTPVLSTVLSIFLFSEVPTVREFIGIGLTVAGILIMVLQGIDRSSGAKVFSYGFVCALLASVLQTCSDLCAKNAISDLPYVSCSSVRGVSGLAAWIVYAVFARKSLFADSSEIKKPRNLGLLALTTVLSTWLGTTLATGSLKYAPAGIATSLKQISPVFILPYDFFVKKKRSFQSVAGTLVAVIGVFLIFY